MVESKSLKLYFNAFRNYQAFHEACTVGIGKTLVELLQPHWLRIGGYWYPRGGMPIDVSGNTALVPKGSGCLIRALLVTAVAADLNQATSRDRARSNICRSTLPPETITTVVLSFRSTAPLSTAAVQLHPGFDNNLEMRPGKSHGIKRVIITENKPLTAMSD